MANVRIYLFLVINVAALLALVVLMMPDGTMDQWVVVGFAMVASLVVPILVIHSETRVLHEHVAAARQELSETQRELAAVKKQAQEAATLDELTGAYNLRHFENLISHHAGIATRGNYTFSICTTKLDNFDALVEKFGREKGDEVLRLFVRIVKSALREVDSVARLGGEKFGIMFSGANEPDSINAVSRIVELIRQIQVDEEDADYRLSSSTGLTEFDADVSSEEMLANAEHALGFAISQGGNRVAAHTHTHDEPTEAPPTPDETTEAPPATDA